MIEGRSYECASPSTWPISCIATPNQLPPYSLAPQSKFEFMIAPAPAMPPTAMGGMVGSAARGSPVATVMPEDAVSMNRMPVERLKSSNISRARCFWVSVMALCRMLP